MVFCDLPDKNTENRVHFRSLEAEIQTPTRTHICLSGRQLHLRLPLRQSDFSNINRRLETPDYLFPKFHLDPRTRLRRSRGSQTISGLEGANVSGR